MSELQTLFETDVFVITAVGTSEEGDLFYAGTKHLY